MPGGRRKDGQTAALTSLAIGRSVVDAVPEVTHVIGMSTADVPDGRAPAGSGAIIGDGGGRGEYEVKPTR